MAQHNAAATAPNPQPERPPWAPLYVDIYGASEVTGVPVSTIRTRRARGQWPKAVKLGVKLYWATSDLVGYMESRREVAR